MPISRQEFDDGRLNFGIPLLQYLRARNDAAFTADEILYALLEIYERRGTPAEVVLMLEDLTDAGLVESKVVAGARVHYCCGESITGGASMPVTKRQFELSITPECEQAMRLAYQFLAGQPEYAFSMAEIKEGLGQNCTADDIMGQLDWAMEVLIGLLAVELRNLGQGPDATDYFAIPQEFDTGTWKSLRGIAPTMPASASS